VTIACLTIECGLISDELPSITHITVYGLFNGHVAIQDKYNSVLIRSADTYITQFLYMVIDYLELTGAY